MLVGAAGCQLFEELLLMGRHDACFDALALVTAPVVEAGVLAGEVASLCYMCPDGFKIGLPVVGMGHGWCSRGRVIGKTFFISKFLERVYG